jgi:spore cortex protein
MHKITMEVIVMKKAIKNLAVVSLIAVSASSIAACGQKAAPNKGTTPGARTQSYQYGAPGYNTGMHPYGTQPHGVAPYANYGTAPNTGGGITGPRTLSAQTAVAERAANDAKKVPGVARATAVCQGNDIVIGIDTVHTTNRTALERKVAHVVKAAEPRYNVYVTSDKVIHQRIRTVSDQVRTGHPVRTLANDISTIIRDIGRAVTAPFR